MGWLREKYTREYLLRRDESGNRTPYGVFGVEHWEAGTIHPRVEHELRSLSLKDARILDIGFGRGESIRYCFQQGAATVVGIDFSEAAIAIAGETLRDLPPDKYLLLCDDVLNVLHEKTVQGTFDHILMLDVIEHLPRSEVDQIMPELFHRLRKGGTLVVHTPFFSEDDDVLATGGKPECGDETDQFEATRGMHINRYSRHGLEKHLKTFGFARWSDYIFLRPCNALPIWRYPGPARRNLARSLGYNISARQSISPNRIPFVLRIWRRLRSSLRPLKPLLVKLRFLKAPSIANGPFRSGSYWEDRYATGGDSGLGSYDELARYKAQIINDFVREKQVDSVVDFGSGDGNQLSLLELPHYVGLDVSETAITKLKKRFADDTSKDFFLYAGGVPSSDSRCHAALGLSLDVIFHLVEDHVFEQYIRDLFSAAQQYVIIYSSNKVGGKTAQHVRHRRFTDFVQASFPDWKLDKVIENPNKPKSHSDFYFYVRSSSND